MGMPSVSATKIVTLDFTQPLSFRVEVGNDMLGGTSFSIGETSGTCTTETVPVPAASAVQFSTLNLITTVEDNNLATNRTAVTYHIRNGGREMSFPFELVLPNNERFALYLIDFMFI